MEMDDGEAHTSAGQDGPVREPFGTTNEITINGERLRIVQATAEQQAAIEQLLADDVAALPTANCPPPAPALRSVGSKFVGVLFLVAAVGGELACGFTDPGPQCAEHAGGGHKTSPHAAPPRRSHPGRRQTEDRPQPAPGHLLPSAEKDQRPECEIRAEKCVNRMPTGQCRILNQSCRLFAGAGDVREMLAGMQRWQEKLLALGQPTPVEPVTDDEARRLFALLRALELESKFHKAPVTRVFMLYCLDGKSRDAVARDCNCSPALITLRLKAIEKKLGRKATALRQISGHFEQIADSLSDSRARRIDRRSAIVNDDPDDEV